MSRAVLELMGRTVNASGLLGVSLCPISTSGAFVNIYDYVCEPTRGTQLELLFLLTNHSGRFFPGVVTPNPIVPQEFEGIAKQTLTLFSERARSDDGATFEVSTG